MCTAISFLTKDHYFGRNLDLEYHYQEAVTYTPEIIFSASATVPCCPGTMP